MDVDRLAAKLYILSTTCFRLSFSVSMIIALVAG
ncbi:unnamed protein product, partial [marine sediment metagenome]